MLELQRRQVRRYLDTKTVYNAVSLSRGRPGWGDEWAGLSYGRFVELEGRRWRRRGEQGEGDGEEDYGDKGWKLMEYSHY